MQINPFRGDMLEYVCCDLCGSSDHSIIYSKIDNVTNWEFHVVRCNCGMVFVNPMPLQQYLSVLYPDHYLNEKPLLDSLYEKMTTILPSPVNGNRLLDVGCGRGDFIRYANAKGWNAEGIDFTDWNGAQQQDITITVGDFTRMNKISSSFNVITAWAVMEHVRQPSEYFRKVAELLAPNGKFVFTVPNVASPGMAYSCDEDTPRHLWLFTPNAVQDYLAKNNMKLERHIHDGSIYRAYPFGLVRRGFFSLIGKKNLSCGNYQNKSVALLQNKPIDIYLKSWSKSVVKQLSLSDIVIDALDLALGVLVGQVSKAMNNYGVMTVVATRDS